MQIVLYIAWIFLSVASYLVIKHTFSRSSIAHMNIFIVHYPALKKKNYNNPPSPLFLIVPTDNQQKACAMSISMIAIPLSNYWLSCD